MDTPGSLDLNLLVPIIVLGAVQAAQTEKIPRNTGLPGEPSRLPLQTRTPPTRTPLVTLHNQLPFTASVAKHEASTPHCIYTGDQC